MSNPNPHPNMVTVEIYRKDKRTRKGEKLIRKEDITLSESFPYELLYNETMNLLPPNERFEIHDTYVEKRNIMSRKDFWERYDTPYYCSPSSETYWCT